MGDSSEPLLSVSVRQGPYEDARAERPDEATSSLQRSLYLDPRNAIKYLSERGVTKLGTLTVENRRVKDLLEDPNAMRTFGSETRDLDWEGVWKQRLQIDELPRSGADWTPTTEVDAFVVNITHAADADDDGIVNPLLKQFMNGVCGIKVFAYPVTKATLNFKWDTWARRYLTMEIADYATWLISFQIFVLLLQDEDMGATTGQLLHTPRGALTIALEVVAYLAMLPFMYIELRSILEYREDWLNAWNVLDVIAYVTQTAILIMHLGRLRVDSNAFSVLCALQVLLLWLRLQYFARVLQPTRQPFMETLRAVISEVKWFILLLVLLIIAFANSFNILFRKDQDKQEFRTVWRSAVTMFTIMMSDMDVDLFAESHNPVAALVLLVFFVFVMSMVLLNCLIALMSDAAGKVNDQEGWQFMLSRAQIIDELETTVPEFLKNKNRHQWYPKYVHFLVLNRDYENLKRLDVGGSSTIEEPEPEDTQGGGTGDESGSAAELQEQVGQLRGELAEVQQQLRRLVAVQEAIAKSVLSAEQAEAIKCA